MAFNPVQNVQVFFEQLLEAFDAGIVLSKHVSVYEVAPAIAQRANNVIWRPEPYIARAFDGQDQSANFESYTQMAIPVAINIWKSSPQTLTATDLNDPLQFPRIAKAMGQILSAKIDQAMMDAAVTYGSVVSTSATSPSGYDDVASLEVLFDKLGVSDMDRKVCYSPRDWRYLASNLAGRQTMQGLPTPAYEKSMIPDVANFDLIRLKYSNRLTANAASSVTINGANQYYTPQAMSGGVPVDNRFQNIDITVGSGTVKVGDAFTLAGVNAVQHVNKADTGDLKTFRIVGIVSGGGGTGTVTITPPIISAQGGTTAEEQYKNVTATPANGAAVTFLNTVTTEANPFWVKDNFEIIPGKFVTPPGAGVAIMQAQSEQGFSLQLTQQVGIDTLANKFRLDVFFGVAVKNTEMAGIQLFRQS